MSPYLKIFIHKEPYWEGHPVIYKMEIGHSLSAFRFRFRQSR